jgi:hypothetical protein
MATIYQMLTKVSPIEQEKDHLEDPLWIFKDDEIDEVTLDFWVY